MPTETEELTLDNVSVEDAGVACKKISIEIPAETISQRLNTGLDTLMSKAALPGFRPGKVPRKLLERRFGGGLRDETKSELMRDAFTQVVTEHDLRVYGDPIIEDEDKLELVEGKPLSFTVEVEVVPDFEMPELENIEVMRPVVEITTDMVDEELAEQQRRRGRIDPVEGKAETGDLFMGLVIVSDEEGNEIGRLTQNVTRLPDPKEDGGSGTIGGIKIEKLAAALKGKKAGDAVAIETTGPDNHEVEAMRGKQVKIDFTIDSVGRLIPATVDELIAMFGLNDEEHLREQIQLALNARAEMEQQDVMRRQVMRYLTSNIEMELPERASARQTERIVESARLRLLSRGVPEVTIEEQIADVRSASAERAQRDLKLHFVLDALADDLKVDVSEVELNGRIHQIARERGERPDNVRQELAKSDRLLLLATQIRHEKGVDALLEKANVSDVSAEEWNKRMAEEDAQDEAASATATESKPKGKKKTTKKKTSSKKTTTKKTRSKKSDD